jgi:hypothetical protein
VSLEEQMSQRSLGEPSKNRRIDICPPKKTRNETGDSPQPSEGAHGLPSRITAQMHVLTADTNDDGDVGPKLHGGKVIDATAFFDAAAFDDLWTLVKPEP